ncbi:BOS complex subunit NOMO3 isoform X2 [Prorops nasuta]|uniref:BOS complex subunit NOMO3 isoform X2 n=1 Tax=Prorops nasuta TaxID=863751 RepID=UPI0034CFA2A8
MLYNRSNFLISLIYLQYLIVNCCANDILGCGGFLKSHADIDFSKVHIKLYTKSGSLKDQTECAPNNGYYFLPLYDKGEYILKVDPPIGWSFEPTEVLLNFDGSTDICSKGTDVNFTFKGFGIAGRVASAASKSGPNGVTIFLYTENDKNVPVGTTTSAEGGTFYFTPIQPGKYILVATHPIWSLKKDMVRVTVNEGNTELEDDSLVVSGYDVSGRVTSEDEAVSGVSFILFGDGTAEKCKTTPIPGYESQKPLCHVVSDQNGRFTFPVVSPGSYKIVPHYAGTQTKFDVQPPTLSFKVEHSSVSLPQEFKVTGFTVSGVVLNSVNGAPLADAKIFLSGREVATTNKNGKYLIDNMKAGQYTLLVKTADMNFDETIVKVSTSSPELPVLVPTGYKICGKVTLSATGTSHYRKLIIQNTATTFYKEIDTNSGTGEYCTYLPTDKYHLSVVVSAEEKAKGLQFFPLQQTIDVTSRPIFNINFLQLKALLTGTVKCIERVDCSQASITLKVLDGVTIKTIQAKDGQYRFSDVLPGQYEVLIDTDIFCWDKSSHKVSVTSEHAEVPLFKHTGFSVTFISSHDTNIEFTEHNGKKNTLSLTKGSTRHCVFKPGAYAFAPKGCHVYAKSSYTWNTNEPSPIILSSTEHTHKGSVISSSVIDGIKVKIETNDDVITTDVLKYTNKDNIYKYEFEFKAKADNMYTITPLSDVLLFSPPSLKVLGVNDCHYDIATFVGDIGKIISGKISPPLEGVTVQIFGVDKEFPVHTLVTQKEGTYNIGPLDGKIDYSVTAEKEGFVIAGPNTNGVFLAHKLAEVIVHVSDQADKSALQGVLLSLSGGQNYRKNSITGEDGKLIFNSLSPGEYYLRPMMKEYRFEPPSKMIKVAEGATVRVDLSGKRIAFSAYGIVTSLNGQPETGLLVEAQGQGNCSSYQEEATTEDTGNFRIRGLQPFCIYIIRLKPSSEANAHIQRSSPDNLIMPITSDIRNLRLVVFHPISRTDISVHVVAEQPEHYRTLKLKLCREDMPDSPIHISKLDSQASWKLSTDHNPGYLIHFPPLQADNKKYFVQLESSLFQNLYKYRTTPVYFEANSSFKSVKLTFSAERKVDQGDVNQTSIIALPFIMLITLAFFNREKLLNYLNVIVENWSKPIPTARASVPAIPIDPRADDIIVEQIMNINKRKVKPRKT